MTTIGILHPGQMGASVGAAAVAAGAEVGWVSAGRSDATRRRAEDAGLRDAGDLATLAPEAEIVLSVCPPDQALGVAGAAMDAGFDGLYVDANAVSPARAREIAACVEARGARYVDGGIVGPPARRAGTTVLYVSGAGAEEVDALFRGSHLEVIRVPGEVGAASALKMAYASYTKGSAALLLAVRALARAEGVEAELLGHWARTHPGLEERSHATAREVAPKGWRFAGEMEEIAATFAAAGLPGGFHQAAAELYRHLETLKDAPDTTLDDVLTALAERR